jgi:hypothetical protein
LFSIQLNHIEYFEVTQSDMFNYKIEGLRKIIPASLAHVADSTIGKHEEWGKEKRTSSCFGNNL